MTGKRPVASVAVIHLGRLMSGGVVGLPQASSYSGGLKPSGSSIRGYDKGSWSIDELDMKEWRIPLA